MNHIDLKDRIIGGRNFTKDYGDPNIYLDNNGTYVAGTIAATEKLEFCVRSRTTCKMLVLKVLAGDGSVMSKLLRRYIML